MFGRTRQQHIFWHKTKRKHQGKRSYEIFEKRFYENCSLFTLFNWNTCKSQLHFVEIVEILLLFCKHNCIPALLHWKLSINKTIFHFSIRVPFPSMSTLCAEQKFWPRMSLGTSENHRDLFMGKQQRSRGLTHLEMSKWRPPVARVSVFHRFILSECLHLWQMRHLPKVTQLLWRLWGRR